MRGSFSKEPQPSELPNLKAVRKGVVAARPLSSSSVLNAADLTYARPAAEFAASELSSLVGRKLKAPVGQGELIRRGDVE